MRRYYPAAPSVYYKANTWSGEKASLIGLSILIGMLVAFIGLIVCMCTIPSEDPRVIIAILYVPLAVCSGLIFLGSTYHLPSNLKTWYNYRKALKAHNKEISSLELKYTREESINFANNVR